MLVVRALLVEDRRLVVEIGGREFEDVDAVVEEQAHPFEIVGEFWDGEMEDSPQPVAGETDGALPALAPGKDGRAADLSRRDFHDIEESVDEVHVMDHARKIRTGDALDLGR